MVIQPSMDHFWKGLKTGKFIPKTDKEIKQFMQENHFGGEAITELSKEDRKVIEKPIFEHLKFNMSEKDELKKLCEQEVAYFPSGIDYYKCPCFILEDCFFEEGEFFKEKNEKGELLTKKEKIKLFSNPNIWHGSILYETNSRGPFTSWGMRSLEGYGFNKEHFGKIIKRVKENTGKNLLNILDVGGASGVALKEIKEYFPKEVITNNLTIDVEPVTYEFDNLYLCPGERFPKKLVGNMDLIISNMAFVYMPGQNLTLENCLQALSVGGEAFLSVEIGKQDYFVQDFPNRMRKQYDRMIHLKETGFIDLKVKSGSHGSHALTHNPKKEMGTWYPPAWIEIKKLKSLEEL